MKKYLLGSGAMLVGAGLMFVLMHGEVSAEGETDRCDLLKVKVFGTPFDNKPEGKDIRRKVMYCKFRDLTCVTNYNADSMSCVKTKGGIFK
jgi:hypothetical protein